MKNRDMKNKPCEVAADHRWVEFHREPTYPTVKNCTRSEPEFEAITYIQHDKCSICRQSREVQMPSGIVRSDRPEKFQCAMCKKFFKYSWSEEEAITEAKAKGFNHYDCATVCDDCYNKTPWGTETL